MRQCPRSGSPDDSANLLPKFGCCHAVRYGKLHPNLRAGMVLVFDFGFGQGGAVKDAPVNRLQAPIDVAPLQKDEERVGDPRLVLVAHREVRVFPLPQDAQALEVAAMLVNVAQHELAAPPAELRPAYASFAALKLDRKSTRLNSSHVRISYAVFCL